MKFIADHIAPKIFSMFKPGTTNLLLVRCEHEPPCKTVTKHNEAIRRHKYPNCYP